MEKIQKIHYLNYVRRRIVVPFDEGSKKKMERLHSKYVFAPADKAANNVIIIWKRY